MQHAPRLCAATTLTGDEKLLWAEEAAHSFGLRPLGLIDTIVAAVVEIMFQQYETGYN
ncbi:MAG: hypothetical protein ABGZ23_16795 [Fuerstiella sp.]